MDVANIVASGRLNLELDLASVSDDLSTSPSIASVEHSRSTGNRLLIHFKHSDALGILVPSGVYVFTGAKNWTDIELAKKDLLTSLSELSIISSPEPDSNEIIDPFEVQNKVYTFDIGASHLDLELLSISIGLEHTEYEPEQFPGLVYREHSTGATLLIFSSGKIVITGVKDDKTANEAKEAVTHQINKII